MNFPKVSYILCVYNGENTLRTCIQSLLSQQKIELELIIINDGSKDQSAHIIESFAEINVCIQVLTQKNRGLAYSRNVGIEKATGEYIASAAQDDVYLPTKSSEQIRYMQEKNLDFSFTNIQTIDELGKSIQFRSMSDYNKQLLPWPISLIQIALFQPVCSPTLLCKRNCFRKIRWNEGLLSASDLQHTLKLFLHFRGGKVPKKLLQRRIRLAEHGATFKPFLGKDFLKFERRVAIVSAFLSFFGTSLNSRLFGRYILVLHSILSLEHSVHKGKLFQTLASLYKTYQFTPAANRMVYLGKN